MIEGSVNRLWEPIVRLVVRGPDGPEEEIEAVVDTGFNGWLSLAPSLIAVLELPYRGQGNATLADGSECSFDIHEAMVVWDGIPRRVSADAADTEPLVGMRLLEGFHLSVEGVVGGNVVIKAI